MSFEVTKEFLQQHIVHHMTIAKQIVVDRGPHDSHDGFRPHAVIIMPNGSDYEIPMPGWQSSAEKNAACWALSRTCELIFARALLIRMNATYLDAAKVAAEIGVKLPDEFNPDKIAYFEKRLTEWRRKMTNGSMYLPDLPEQYRYDGIVVSSMAPRIEDMGSTALYRWEGKRVNFFDEKNSWDDVHYHLENRMIPKWWN